MSRAAIHLGTLLFAMSAAPALAAPEDGELQKIRKELTRYDLEGGTTLELLAQLGPRIEQAKGIEYPELRFLRAAVGADLYLIAALHRDQALLSQVADALGQSDHELVPWLREELASAQAQYRAPALAISRALGYQIDPDPEFLDLLTGTQGDLLRVFETASALEGATNAITALAPLADDPCAEGEKCLGVYRVLDAEARRAAAALALAAISADRLVRSAEAGDPLASTLRTEASAIQETLIKTTLRPVPRIEGDVGMVDMLGAEPYAPELVLIVKHDAVHYGYAPQLRIARDGALQMVAAGTPMLPVVSELSHPRQVSHYMRPLDAVSALLRRALADHPDLRIAVGASGATKAHLLGRALLALRQSGRQQAFILTRSTDGFARALRVALVASGHEQTAAPVRLRVRHGSSSLQVGGRLLSIPRVRDEDGVHFDLATLADKLGDEPVPQADISFMDDVPASTLVTAMLGVAQRSQDVRLVFR